MPLPRKPALANLLTPDLHSATTRRIEKSEVEAALREAELGRRLVSGTRKIVSAEEIADHLAQREVADSVSNEDESVDVPLDSLVPPPQRLSPLTPVLATDAPRVDDPSRTTLAHLPSVMVLLLLASGIFTVLAGLAYLLGQ